MKTTECFHLPVMPLKIAARLYILAGLALATVVLLSTAALHFVTRTGEDVRDIRKLVQVELSQVYDMELLLERHRRIVESAPVELDRERIAHLRDRARDVIEDMYGNVPKIASGPGAALGETLAELTTQGERALDLAAEFAQEEAIKQVAAYSAVARKIQTEIASTKIEHMSRFERDLKRLAASGNELTRWVEVGTLVALLLIGPFSLLVTGQIVRRLKRMTQTMLRLAEHDTSVHVSGTRFRDELGDMARALSVFKANAIELLSQQREIQTLNRRFKFALDNMSRGLSMFDSERRLIVCNARYGELYGLPEHLLVPGTPFSDIRRWRISNGTGVAGDTIDGPGKGWPFESRALIDRGEMIPLAHDLEDGRIIQVSFQPLDGGGWVALHEDATEERRQDARIERLAHFDSVTNIANRYFFKERLDSAFGDVAKSEIGFAVHWIDLDRFKEVNDTFGHPTGDALLQQVAARLNNAVRADDFVARLGGDEFAVIQTGVQGNAETEPLALRLIRVLSEPYMIGALRIEIGASVGVVVAPLQGETAEDLIRNADIALYQAKASGRGCHVNFEPALIEDLKARRSLEADLLEALRGEVFDLHYQPILDLSSGTVTVCEALMRWKHPVRGFVSPAVFIPVAEEMGAICELGEFALRRACTDAAHWPDGIKVAVNLSAVQFAEGDLYQTVLAVLAETGLAPHRLELEITETVLMRDDAATIQTLVRLRDLGITIALDDFGTGFSSLNYLRRFPFDKIKIDQSFIRDLPSRTECVAIVRAIADLAKTLGMRTVAEGVETNDHLQRVASAGCDAVQGYLISRPVAREALAGAIANACGRAHAVAA
ncbi:MAG: EAL domain-containing protein [Hyphomicrobiaceae bacterium]